jgi:integrase/recombinase XerD
VDGKTGPREAPISPEVREQLIEVAGGEYVFNGPNGHLTTQWVYYLIRSAFEAAGIRGRKLGPHTLRHTFGRMFIMAGGDAFSLQKILGHSNIQTTRIYVELNTADIVSQHHKFTPLHLVQAGSQGRLIAEAESIIRTMGREDHG